MLCFPFSRWSSTRFRMRSTFSAISSAETVDHRSRICSGSDGLRHLSARTENGTEPLTDDCHQRRLGDEVIGIVSDLLCLFLVVRDRSEFLGGDHGIGHVLGFQG